MCIRYKQLLLELQAGIGSEYTHGGVYSTGWCNVSNIEHLLIDAQAEIESKYTAQLGVHSTGGVMYQI